MIPGDNRGIERMADTPGKQYASSHSVSRSTIVMRRAKDDDARRVANRDDDGVVVHENPDASNARLTARGAATRAVRGRQGERSMSGRNVEVRQQGAMSDRCSVKLSGRQATTIRVAGGDTIIRYRSGDMVIKRGARRVLLRKRSIQAYALGYLVLFGLFMYWLFTGSVAITPGEFVDRAFSRRRSSSVADLERAAFEAMRGNRTPAEIRLARNLSFYDEEKNAVHVEKGNRLTLLTAAKLGRAIIEDQKLTLEKREFREPILVYRETQLAGVDWPHLMTIYNAIGFFLLLALFLWRPAMHYLGTQGKKTAVALRNARDAMGKAAEYREQYRQLAGEMEEKEAELTAGTASRLEKEREEALEQARRQAEEISGNIQGALRNEERRLAADIGAETVQVACDQAKEILQRRLGQAEHDAAIEELIAGIAASMRPEARARE